MYPTETKIYHGLIIAGLFLIGLFIFLTIIIFRSQRRYIKDQQNRFIAELVLLEKERTRIARDLHDELGSRLSVTILQISEAEKLENNAIDLLQKAQQNIVTTNQRLGEIARNLTPQSLASKGLDFALQEFLGQFELPGRLTVEYKYEVKTMLGETDSLQLFRMIQEIVNNTLKHAEASTIRVQLRERKQKLYVLCCDNGKGFNSNSISGNRKGLGLDSLRNRAELLGGKMRFSSINGTEYFFEMPLIINAHEKYNSISDS